MSDPVDVVGLTRSLVDIDSTTGQEGEAGRWLAGYLRSQGFAVIEQPVDEHRFNVMATLGPPLVAPPLVTLSTHFDCVPPFFSSRVEAGRIYGRGSCDAKGILAAQVAAVDRLRRQGETRVGLLFVVGEERGSDGARVANTAVNDAANTAANTAVNEAAPARRCRFLVNGEPTDSRLGIATRGALRLRLKASGRAAHSSFPELGISAIDTLLDALVALREIELPEDPVLGRTHYTIGLIRGGVAPNVVSPSAEAEVMFRTVSDAAAIRAAIAPIARRVAIEYLLEVPPVRLTTLPAFASAVFPYTTDIPFLTAWGEPLLFGPGSIHTAHTADEFIEIDELQSAVDGYATIARELLERSVR